MQGSFDGVGQVITDHIRRYRTVLLLERLVNRAIEAIRYMYCIRKQPLQRRKPFYVINIMISTETKAFIATLYVGTRHTGTWAKHTRTIVVQCHRAAPRRRTGGGWY